MKTVCCVCRREKVNGDWKENAAPPASADGNDGIELVSHGYCPDCAAVARVELALMQLADGERTAHKVA